MFEPNDKLKLTESIKLLYLTVTLQSERLLIIFEVFISAKSLLSEILTRSKIEMLDEVLVPLKEGTKDCLIPIISQMSDI